MHGSWLWWCPDHNLIYDFKLYDGERVSNKKAKDLGHIAIPAKYSGSKPFVSFKDIDESDTRYDVEGCRVGITIPHYLIDFRNHGNVNETNRYPIVKIGYNQFWMSKSIRTRVLNNDANTPLIDYSNVIQGENDYKDDNWFRPGYVYPGKYTKSPELGKEKWDVELLYNTNALLADGFVPISPVAAERYQIPNKAYIEKLWDYIGWHFMNKLLSGDNVRDESSFMFVGKYPPKTEDEAIARGFFNRRNGRCANVSGFNLKATGIRNVNGAWPENGDDGQSCAILLNPGDKSKENLFIFSKIESFESSPDLPSLYSTNKLQIEVGGWQTKDKKYNQGAVFAPVRLFIEFNGIETGHKNHSSRPSQQPDAPTAKRQTIGSRSVGNAVSRNVYIDLIGN